MSQWPDHLALLDRFRDWLYLTREEYEELDESNLPVLDVSSESDGVGLYALVEQLTALRHDAKQLTKASRRSQEQTDSAIRSMEEAVAQMRLVEPRESEVTEKAVRPFVQSLIDLDESLSRGRHVIEQARNRVLNDLNEEIEAMRRRLDELYSAQNWWRKLLCRRWHQQVRKIHSDVMVQRSREIFDSLLEGFDLTGKRLQRTMQQQSITRIDCVGRQVDPNTMSVVEAVHCEQRPAGTVIEEVRPGYLWNGTVFRYAEVKAVQHTHAELERPA